VHGEVVNENNNVMLAFHKHLQDNLDNVSYLVVQIHHNQLHLSEIMDQGIEDEYMGEFLPVQHDDLLDHVEPIA
jgi:hypothetical protein